jgi:hypothetical protein
LNLISIFDPGPISESFDLRRGLNTTISDDLLDDTQPCLDPLDVRRILGSLFGSLIRDKLAHALLVLEPALERAEEEATANRDGNDDHEEDKHRKRHRGLLSSD